METKTPPYIIHSNFLNIVLDGKPYMLNASDKRFKQCKEKILAQDWVGVRFLLDKVQAITLLGKGLVTYSSGKICYRGEPIHSTLTERMVRLLIEGKNITPMVRFLENLMENPSVMSITELYSFLEATDLPLTEDGCFLAYKRVRNDWTDIRTGSVDNSIGATPSMDRDLVEWDRNKTCSSGYHACSLSYLPHYAMHENDRVILVKINPRDVVSIPKDYNNAKMRICAYEVFAEYDSVNRFKVSPFKSSLVLTKRSKSKLKKKGVVEVSGRTPRESKRKVEVIKNLKKTSGKRAARSQVSGPYRDSRGRFISKKS